MNSAYPADKDMAEFFRLGLIAGICDVSMVALWAESIVSKQEKPHFAFIELCMSINQPVSSVLSLLLNVPGHPTTGIPIRMVFGYCFHRLSEAPEIGEWLLVRLYRMTQLEDWGSEEYFELVRLEDDLSLARDSIFGSIKGVMKKLSTFLRGYAASSPNEEFQSFSAVSNLSPS